MGMHGLRGIELTDTQKDQLKAIMAANKPSPETMEQMRALMDARRAGTLTEDQKSQFKQLRQAQREKMQSVHLQIQGILTDEQKAQIETKKQEMKQRMEQRRLLRLQKKADTVKPIEN